MDKLTRAMAQGMVWADAWQAWKRREGSLYRMWMSTYDVAREPTMLHARSGIRSLPPPSLRPIRKVHDVGPPGS